MGKFTYRGDRWSTLDPSEWVVATTMRFINTVGKQRRHKYIERYATFFPTYLEDVTCFNLGVWGRKGWDS